MAKQLVLDGLDTQDYTNRKNTDCIMKMCGPDGFHEMWKKKKTLHRPTGKNAVSMRTSPESEVFIPMMIGQQLAPLVGQKGWQPLAGSSPPLLV